MAACVFLLTKQAFKLSLNVCIRDDSEYHAKIALFSCVINNIAKFIHILVLVFPRNFLFLARSPTYFYNCMYRNTKTAS